MNKVKSQREKLNYTQAELAQKSGLSVRTIQRIESGVQPKGYTLSALAEALEVGYDDLRLPLNTYSGTDSDHISILRYINLSVLGFFIFPFGNILFPFLLWKKNKSSEIIEQVGREIINIQILWSLVFCTGLSISPFIDKGFSLSTPLIFIVLIVGVILNICLISYQSNLINRKDLDSIKSPIHFF